MSDDDESHSKCTTVPTLHQKNIVLTLSGPIFSQFKSVQVSTGRLHEQHGLGSCGRLAGLLHSSEVLELVGSVAMCRL